MYGDPETIRHLINFKQLQGKFVDTQAAVFSANMIGTVGLCPILWWSGKFEPVKPNPPRSRMPGSLLIAFKNVKWKLDVSIASSQRGTIDVS